MLNNCRPWRPNHRVFCLLLALIVVLAGGLVLEAGGADLQSLQSQSAIAPAYNFRPVPPTAGRGITVAIIGEGVDSYMKSTLGKRLLAESVLSSDPDPINRADVGAVATEVMSLVGGLAPQARIISIKALDASGGGGFKEITDAINRAAELKAKIIVLTCGAPEEDAGTTAAVKKALKKGILMVAPAGNSGSQSNIDFPANVDGVVAVGASDENDKIVSYSNYSGKVIFAPGDGVTAVSFGGESKSKSGTVYAAGVAGAIFAVLWSQKPGLTRQQLVSFVVNNAALIEDPGGGEARRIDAQAALNAVKKAAK